MKWFIKALWQYADFSGRARRKEYWMFALFNWIFSVVLMILAVTDTKDRMLSAISSLASLHYTVVMLLPGMALSVRRLHDLGKSGWWMFITLIPIIGGIWLFVLMVTEGQSGDNRYGPNPKTAADAFDRRAQLKSAGVTLTVASVAAILLIVLNQLIEYLRYQQHQQVPPLMYYLQQVPFWLGYALLLMAGIRLWRGKVDVRTQGFPRTALYLLLAATLLFFLINVYWTVGSFIVANSLLNAGNDVARWFLVRRMIELPLHSVCWLLTLLFFALRLFVAQNRRLICIAATLATVFWGIYLLWFTYYITGNMQSANHGGKNSLQALVSALATYGQVLSLLTPVALIVLIRTLKAETLKEVALKNSHEGVGKTAGEKITNAAVSKGGTMNDLAVLLEKLQKIRCGMSAQTLYSLFGKPASQLSANEAFARMQHIPASEVGNKYCIYRTPHGEFQVVVKMT
jgi:uncharacterized membrane protein YhaH (DUF805 family)